MKKIKILLISTLLVACEYTPLKDVLDSWYLGDINDYIKANGYPSSSVSLPSGNTVYRFVDRNNNWHCTIELEVNAQQTIVHWRYSGNNCY